MLQIRKNLFILATMILAGWAVAGCGANKVTHTTDGSSDQSSRVDPRDNNGKNGPGDHGMLAECTGFHDSTMGLTGQMATFYDPTSGEFIPDFISMRLENLPSAVISGNQHIKIFRWGENDTGGTFTNSDPVEMYIQQKGTGRYLNTEAITDLSKPTVKAIISNNDLGSEGVTPSNFFSKVHVVLVGMDLQYDALLLALYDPSQGTDAIDWISSLIPAFSADPNRYAQNHLSTDLIELHPMYPRRNGGLSESQYFNEMEKFCSAFFQ